MPGEHIVFTHVINDFITVLREKNKLKPDAPGTDIFVSQSEK